MLDLTTPMARVDYAAHIYENHIRHMGYRYVYDFCSQKGCSKREIEDGAILGEARHEMYAFLRGIHGDPMYGGGAEWNFAANFDREIIEHARNVTTEPLRGLQAIWIKAAEVLRKYSPANEVKAA